MLFNSISFLIFFPIVAVLYALTPRNWRWLLLLAASCYFYMSFIPVYILILFSLIAIDFTLGILIERSAGRNRKLLLTISICANLGTLFVFKYFNFFNANLASLAHLLDWNYRIETLRFLLPLGLSYHVFQSLSYVIEVYYKRVPSERHLGIYALYVMFFPQLVAGPIEKPQQLLPQLKRFEGITFPNLRAGLEIVGWGFFKKVIIADNIGVFVDAVYRNLHASSGPALAAAMFAFAIQLYADFSGYSDIAVGTARVFGVDLINNFNFPFFSRSVAELWRRWHISLSTWARDYVYYPLAVAWAGRGRLAVHLAVFVTFVLLGLWHGAGWNYIAMGAVFGMYVVAGTLTKTWRAKAAEMTGLAKAPLLYGAVQTLITFVISCAGWVFFRAQSVRDAFYLLGHLGAGWPEALSRGLSNFFGDLSPVALPQPAFSLALFSLAILMVSEFLEFRFRLISRLKEERAWFRWATYYGFVLLFLVFALTSKSYEQKAFIYFQF